MNREDLGRIVRETWVKWASEQPDPKPSWLTEWEDLDDGQREVDMRIGEAVAAAACAVSDSLPDGQWLEIAFMGHIEYRGDRAAYVREVTRNGQPAYRLELPDYVFGGDPSAVRHHAASAWFGDQPVSEESVRRAWEAKREAARIRRQREAEWERQQAERALPAGENGSEGERFGCTCEEDDLDPGCPEHGNPF